MRKVTFEAVAEYAEDYWGLRLSRAKTKRAQRQFVVTGQFPGMTGRQVRRFETLEDAARALKFPGAS